MFLNAETAVRLTVPFFVAKKRWLSSSVSRKWSMALTRSPGSTGMRFTMFVPFEARLPSGI